MYKLNLVLDMGFTSKVELEGTLENLRKCYQFYSNFKGLVSIKITKTNLDANQLEYVISKAA